VLLATASRTFFGESLPDGWLGWLTLLLAVWGGMGVLQTVMAAFIQQHREEPLKIKHSGYILPAGWVLWGCLLIYAEPHPFPVLVVLVGLLAVLISATELRRRI
jgi:Na+/proline symporter